MNYFSGLEFLGFGAVEQYSHWATKNIKDYYTLQYAHTGGMHLGTDSDDNVRKYEAPFAWLMYKKRYFRFGNPDMKPWGHYYVLFKGPRVKEYIKSGLYPIDLNPPVVRIGNSTKFLNDMLELQRWLKEYPNKPEQAVHMLEGLLLQLHSQPRNIGGDKHFSDKIRFLVKEINDSPLTEWDFNSEAQKMGLSYSHFRALFKEEMGCPPHQYALRCRLHKAATMLSMDKDASIQAVAEENGFDNLFYFNRIFKKYHRLPPAKFRKELC